MGSSSDLPADLLGYGHPESPTGSLKASAPVSAMSSARSSVNSRPGGSTDYENPREALKRNLSGTHFDNTNMPGALSMTSGTGSIGSNPGDAGNSLRRKPVGSRATSHARPTAPHQLARVDDHDAYTYALRAAFLAYLLQPRQKRTQHVANTSKPLQRSSTSIHDMVKDFSLIRDSKSTRFPHGFMSALDKRITKVLVGTEKGAEYSDPLVKRTFANFLNEFKNPTFRKTMEKDRRVEDLLLIFYSRATSELAKGKGAGDEGWKWMVDRHVALFVRLISSTLSNNDWTRDRPELSGRLKTLETKLLQNDSDLASDTGKGSSSSAGQSVEVEVPRSYEVRDMPLVIRVCSVFAKPTAVAQNDINANKEIWTEKAALKDLKDYQNHMMLNTRVTLNRDDFENDEAFEAWRKGEFSDLSQMMLAIVQSNPELAKTSSSGGTGLPTFRPELKHTDSNADASRNSSASAGADQAGAESYVIDQPVDISSLSLGGDSPRDSATGGMDPNQTPAGHDFTFIPPDARSYYCQLLKIALTHDLADADLEPPPTAEDGSPGIKLLSRQSTELLNEVALRWRIPIFTRMVLFLEVIREKYCSNQEITLDTVDAAFMYVKEPPVPELPGKKGGGSGSAGMAKEHQTQMQMQAVLFDRSRWTIADRRLMQEILSHMHDALLRELFELFTQCYESKPPSIGSVMYVLDTHIYSDDALSPSSSSSGIDAFSVTLSEALRQKAQAKYQELLAKHVPSDAAGWEFYNIMQLGKAVSGLGQKIEKRYRKNPVIMGVNPHRILIEEVMPSFCEDCKELVQRIIAMGIEKGVEVPVEDGFELYRELCDVRRVWTGWFRGQAGSEFPFSVEELLAEFVWRWIKQTDALIVSWVEGAVGQDDFQIRQDPREKEAGLPPTDDERHSQSAVDIYRMFNQSIEQLAKLEWDDDLMYAKFMTAMSKSVGRGVARYCELLEGKFKKEMDRQTPEQEARAQQTQKEKWISAARDAWATGGRGGMEKIEPFQFWTESFVKMNDIEFATLQLDKLEKEINVDACAEVINRLDPPPPPHIARRQAQAAGGAAASKFMFTIKIIEAEDLKAGDANGLSDPYVVLGDEYQKRLAKTRTVYGSLNPRWDETVDILTTGPLNAIATVWDWDMLGDHDCLGRTSLKLDPSHFNDFLPREYWLDLDTQGRVLVRVSMEGERDDIQFYFGKAFRTLKRTERDMARKVTDKLTAYIQQCLSRRTLRALLSQGGLGGVAMQSAKGYFSKLSSQVSGRPMSVSGPSPTTPGIGPQDASNALQPLLNYFDDNFAIMKQTLTDSAMITVMTRLWKEVLVTLESLLVPPLSDKPSTQRPLSQQEVDIVYRWLGILFDFFHAYDEEDKTAHGVPLDVLKSAKFFDLQNLNFFYFESTENLIRTSDGIAQATARRQQEAAQAQNKMHSRFSAPPTMGPASPSLGGGMHGARRTKSIMMSRNLGTMRKAKEEKRKEAQADPNDDMILRILRMRPEAERYLKDRSRQKERLAAAAAAEAIVRQSLLASRQQAVNAQHAQLQQNSGGAGGLTRRWDTIRE
ncbi:hypothetical protein KC351_g12754 [Hortaea werneckii]|nr:hypothetical protein KC351_g12754 [Hortaea werneckii]